MNNDGQSIGPGVPAASLDEAALDGRRYLAALSRSRWLIATIVILITVLVVLLSLATTKRYEATSTVVVEVPTSELAIDTPDVERLLPTYAELLTATPTLDSAAKELGFGDAEAIEDKVEASADPAIDLIEVTARDPSPQLAADIADAVAVAFIDSQLAKDQARIAAAIRNLRARLTTLDPGSVEAQQLRNSISSLTIQRTTGVLGLSLIDADVPTSPASPKPLRNGILAFFFAAFLGILVALARDQLRPSVGTLRELSRLTRMQVLAGIPFVSGRGRGRHHEAALEHEAYQSLGAAIQVALPASGQHVIMITSALHGEGKTTATARLGRVLAEAGHDTLLISGDLRWPALHEAFGVPVEPGLSDVLELVQRSGLSRHLLPATVRTVPMSRDSAGRERNLDVLTSGKKVRDPATLLSGEALGAFLDHVRSFPYSYVIIDGPPMLGIADGQAIAQQVDRVVVVSQLDRLTVENVVDMRDLLDRLEAAPLGHIVIGARVQVSPYYQSERARQAGAAAGGGVSFVDEASGGTLNYPASREDAG